MKKHILTLAFKPVKCILTTSSFTVISRTFAHQENYYKTHFLKSLSLFTKIIQYLKELCNMYEPFFEMQHTEITLVNK